MYTTTRTLYDVTLNDEQTLNQIEVTTQPPPASSVTISQNAKGQAQVEVKIYHEDPEYAATAALALYRRLTRAVESPTLPL